MSRLIFIIDDFFIDSVMIFDLLILLFIFNLQRSSRIEKNPNTNMTRNSQHHRSNDDTSNQTTLRRNTLNKSSSNHNIRQSTSHGNLADDSTMEFLYNTTDRNGGLVKRTKSFWKFGKSDDILEGMALWKHRDLVQTENERNDEKIKEGTLKRTHVVRNGSNHSNSNNSGSNETLKNGNIHDVPVVEERMKFPLTKSDIDHRISRQSENIYGIHQQTPSPTNNKNNMKRYEDDVENDENEDDRRIVRGKETYRNSPNDKSYNSYYDSQENLTLIDDDMSLTNNDSIRIRDTNFYDDESVQDMLMKTVKRKDILKQYYSSGTDTERNSSSSDPYDCIVVDDHLVRKENRRNNNNNNNNTSNNNNTGKMEFSTFRGDKKEINLEPPLTGTLLPRTKLSKTSSVGPVMQTALQMDKENERRESSQNNRRSTKNRNSTNTNSQSKAYGPWYDLWGKEGIPQK